VPEPYIFELAPDDLDPDPDLDTEAEDEAEETETPPEPQTKPAATRVRLRRAVWVRLESQAAKKQQATEEPEAAEESEAAEEEQSDGEREAAEELPVNKRRLPRWRPVTVVLILALAAVSTFAIAQWRQAHDLSAARVQRKLLEQSSAKVASTFFNWDYQHMQASFTAKYALLTKSAADAIRPTAPTLTAYFTNNKAMSGGPHRRDLPRRDQGRGRLGRGGGRHPGHDVGLDPDQHRGDAAAQHETHRRPVAGQQHRAHRDRSGVLHRPAGQADLLAVVHERATVRVADTLTRCSPRRTIMTDNGVRGRHHRIRARSIRRRIALQLVIPLLSMIALYAFGGNYTLGAALNKFHTSTVYDKVVKPGQYVTTYLELERALTAVAVSSHGQAGRHDLMAQRAATDSAIASFLRSVQSSDLKDVTNATVRQWLDDFIRRLSGLPAARRQIDTGRTSTLAAMQVFSDLIGSSLHLYSGLPYVSDLTVTQESDAVLLMGWSWEYMLRENALIGAVLAAPGARMDETEYNALVGWITVRRHYFAASTASLSPTVGRPFTAFAASVGYQQLTAAENDVAASRVTTRLPASMMRWEVGSAPLLTTWQRAIVQAGSGIATQARQVGNRIVLRLVLIGGAGLVAVLLSILLSVRLVRRFSRELGDLEQAVGDLADRKLPLTVARLRRGEDVDLGAQVPVRAPGRTTEIERVAEAFTAVQQTAIRSAVGEARVRSGISRVFVNLAWRSQSLLHRQLRTLDAMERRASNPEDLEQLFRLDHLTTQMRRNAEGLVILSGAPTGRGWNQPVPLEDVLRAAVAEVEDYTRVGVVASSAILLVGPAVADVIHLVAELVDNATTFSPPPSEVEVRGEIVGNGYAIEVVDQGIGLDPADRVELNERLAQDPEFDLTESDRLGLFVVATLAARRGIRVTLEPSVHGGTTAVALIPQPLVTTSGRPDSVPGEAALPPVRFRRGQDQRDY
jgi:signal transduction histidine kinase